MNSLKKNYYKKEGYKGRVDILKIQLQQFYKDV